jgi:outer membrane receptor protein involved in Fe transport
MNYLYLSAALAPLLLAAPAMAETAAPAATPPAATAAAPAETPIATAPKAFSTGVAKGRDLLDSAISASTLDVVDLPKVGTSSVAGIIGNLPGIRAESSGIDGNSSLTVRGLPLAADGSKYLQIQEDGLPVLEFGDIHFGSTDEFVRADLGLSQVQVIRGGSASTFASNSPGGLINFISKTGDVEGGAVQVSSGLDHDLNRVDFDYGAPLADGWRFHVGGFYRQGEGPRDIGYDGFQGGQIKANLTRQFSNGYIRFYTKYLDDRQPTMRCSR